MTLIPTIGLLSFPSSVLCSKETLGQEISVSVGSHAGKLLMPILPSTSRSKDNQLDRILLPPACAVSWKRGDKKLYWGRPVSYPSLNSSVELAILRFDIEKEHQETITQEIYKGMPNWIDLFSKYLLLLTKNKTNWNDKESIGSDFLEFYSVHENGLKLLSSNEPINISVNMPGDDDFIRPENLTVVCNLCSKGLIPKLEYRILLESYYARGGDDYRKAIIEAASALEVCLTNRILEEFDSQGIKFGEKLLSKFRMLGGRFELIRLLDIPLPSKDYSKLIMEPRNEVIHKAKFLDKKVADQVIEEVENLLKRFSPEVSQHEKA